VKKYLACLGLFILALLSKPMAITLPLLFILLDYWPLGRLQPPFRKALLEKTPFFIAALLSSGVAVISQFQAGAGWGLGPFPFSFRLMNAFHSLVFYLGKMLFPAHLAAYYPILPEQSFSPEYLASALLVLLATLICVIYRKKYPSLAVAWLYYVLTLAPVLGIVQVGNQAAADRFTYLPSLGPFLLVAGVLSKLFFRNRLALILLAALGATLLGYGTFRQAGLWKDSVTLWENVVKLYPYNNLIVHNNLGRAYEDAGRLDEALGKFNDAAPNGFHFFYSHWGKGRVLARKGLWDQSIQEYQTALAMNPHYPPMLSELGLVYEKKGSRPEALAAVLEAVQVDPRFGDGYLHLGDLYRGRGQFKEALEAYRKAYLLDPDNADYFRGLVKDCEEAGQFREAKEWYGELSSRPRSLLSLSF